MAQSAPQDGWLSSRQESPLQQAVQRYECALGRYSAQLPHPSRSVRRELDGAVRQLRLMHAPTDCADAGPQSSRRR